MAIDLLKTLQNLEGDFRGAVLLTYTLDLTFFEQLVAPKLTALGCSNVLIITDRYGYNEALQRGGRNLSGVGKRYVCTSLPSPGWGVQHAKLLLLVGPQRGCLLVGSGNLTIPGYGRNLEQFTRFDFDLTPGKPPLAEQRHPFSAVWRLIRQLHRQDDLSTAAGERLTALAELAPWLDESAAPSSHLHLWHSLEQPLFKQLPTFSPLTELHLIAPFFDLTVIGNLVKRLRPARLIVGVDAHQPNLDGPALAERCRAWDCELELRALAGRDPQRRSLHAKTIVGVSDSGAWSISGSANLTYPAWHSTWVDGGNLELVIWQHDTDPDVPAKIWDDEQLLVQPRPPDTIYPPQEAEPEAEDAPDDETLRLVELHVRANQLAGQLVWETASPDAPQEANYSIELLRNRGSLIPIQPGISGRFAVTLSAGLAQSEAGCVVANLNGQQLVSPYHWIDQLDELARFGHRSYRLRVKQQLETFGGAGRLFEDLLNFLWRRVDPQQIQQEHREQEALRRRSRRNQVEQDVDGETVIVPPAEDFITEEVLVAEIGWHVDGYAPHERSTVSLRDLLSLVLLRLTTETTSATVGADTDASRDEDADAQHTQEQEAKRRHILEQLRDSLLRYCTRYARRLLEPEFVASVGPQLLFENHFTLGRILLEFTDKAGDYFRQDHLRQAVQQILGALFWPPGAGLDGPAAWHSLQTAGHDIIELRRYWAAAQMPALTATLIAEAWDHPPRWTTALSNQSLVQRYLLAQELIRQIEQTVGSRAWHLGDDAAIGLHDLWGFRQITPNDDDTLPPTLSAQIKQQVKQLTAYRTPVEEKYADLFTWWQLKRRKDGQSARLAELSQKIEADGYAGDLVLLKTVVGSGQLYAIQGDSELCPKCNTYLSKSLIWPLRSGKFIKCLNCYSGPTILYWQPVLKIQKTEEQNQ